MSFLSMRMADTSTGLCSVGRWQSRMGKVGVEGVTEGGVLLLEADGHCTEIIRKLGRIGVAKKSCEARPGGGKGASEGSVTDVHHRACTRTKRDGARRRKPRLAAGKSDGTQSARRWRACRRVSKSLKAELMRCRGEHLAMWSRHRDWLVRMDRACRDTERKAAR